MHICRYIIDLYVLDVFYRNRFRASYEKRKSPIACISRATAIGQLFRRIYIESFLDKKLGNDTLPLLSLSLFFLWRPFHPLSYTYTHTHTYTRIHSHLLSSFTIFIEETLTKTDLILEKSYMSELCYRSTRALIFPIVSETAYEYNKSEAG